MTATERKQWRVVFHGLNGTGSGVAFVDSPDEAGARKFFAQAFRNSVIVGVTLEPTNPCAAYERREP